MKLQKFIIFSLFNFLFIAEVHSQNTLVDYAGTYSDAYSGMAFTTLKLNEDGSFDLKTYDPIFPYTFLKFENKGIWTAEGNELVLNPDLQPYVPHVSLKEKIFPSDSLQIHINYILEEHQDNVLLDRATFDFNQLTIYINKKKNFFNLVQQEKKRICSFSPKIKNQVVLDKDKSFGIPKQEITRIGIQSYGFNGIKWFEIKDSNSNLFEFHIIHPIDKDRRPRNRKMIAKGMKLFYYQKNGEVNTSLLAGRLWKKK